MEDNNIVLIIGILGSVASIIGLVLYFKKKEKSISIGNQNENVIFGKGNVIDNRKITNIHSEKRECNTPLTFTEQNRFKGEVVTISATIKHNPIAATLKFKNKLSELFSLVNSNYCYEKQLKLETAILLRMYSASQILGARNPHEEDPKSIFISTFPAIERSYQLLPELWSKQYEINSYRHLKSLYATADRINFGDKALISKYLRSAIALALIDSTDEELNKIHLSITKQVQGVWKDKKYQDFEFFQKSKIGSSDYLMLIQSVKMIINGQGGQFNGPELEKHTKGTIIRFNVNGLPKKPVFEWLVDKESNTIKPLSEGAVTTENSFKKI